MPREITPPAEQPQAHPAPFAVATTQQQLFAGPLPAPATVGEYEKALPGAAERIFLMAEQQAAHRQQMENRRLDLESKQLDVNRTELLRGQPFGLIIGLAAIGAGAWTSIAGQPWAGGFIGTTGVVGLVSVFVLGRTRR